MSLSLEQIQLKYYITFTPFFIKNYLDIILYLFNLENSELIDLNMEDKYVLYLIGVYYNNISKYTESDKYYLLSYEKGYTGLRVWVARHYIHTEINYEKAEKILIKCVENHELECYQTLRVLYYKDKKYLNKLKIIIWLEDILKKILSNKSIDITSYYIIGIQNGYNFSLTRLPNYYNKLYLHYTLLELPTKTEIINSKIKELEEMSELKDYKDSISRLVDKEECVVCAELNCFLQFKCGHHICVECFPKMKKCYYNCVC